MIEELNFWWEILPRKLNEKSDKYFKGKFTISVTYVYTSTV